MSSHVCIKLFGKPGIPYDMTLTFTCLPGVKISLSVPTRLWFNNLEISRANMQCFCRLSAADNSLSFYTVRLSLNSFSLCIRHTRAMHIMCYSIATIQKCWKKALIISPPDYKRALELGRGSLLQKEYFSYISSSGNLSFFDSCIFLFIFYTFFKNIFCYFTTFLKKKCFSFFFILVTDGYIYDFCSYIVLCF